MFVNPTTTIPPARIGYANQPTVNDRPVGRFPTSANAGIPEITVPAGFTTEVYDLIRAEAQRGRTFLWYTTEVDELKNCDRAYVFRNGAIVAELARDELNEEQVIHSSFADAD